MKSIVNNDFSGETVLVRVDFNVPLDDDFNIIDDSRIEASLPTIKKLMLDGAKIILMSHLGRPSGFEDRFSLKHLVSHLNRLLQTNIFFSQNCVGEKTLEQTKSLKRSEVLLLENLRFHQEESLGDLGFAKKLSSLANVYVNDAFGTCHRKHASTCVIAQFFPNNRYAGLLLKKEIDNLELALSDPAPPFTAIIGGAKISSKIDVILSLLEKVDTLIVGGAMAYTFVKASGGKVGKSLVEIDKLDVANRIMEKANKKGVNFLLPVDSINADGFNNKANIRSSDITNIDKEYLGMDIGEKSINLFSSAIQKSKTILWNGPMGVFEMSNFQKGTRSIANAICSSTASGSFSLIGGGDSVAAIKKFGMETKVSYISTGGGAMLEYLEGKDLPGIKAIL